MAGEISVAESNHNSDVAERRKNRAKHRNIRCPREGRHQVVVPLWMDDPYLRRYMEEHGCTMAAAIKAARRKEGL